jgi:hypothetical protein
MAARSTLVAAIRDRHVVELSYQGDGPLTRLVHPHALYRSSTGKICLDAYQVGGPTRSGSLPMWRVFDLAKLRVVDVLTETFEPDPGYRPSSPKYRGGLIAGA